MKKIKSKTIIDKYNALFDAMFFDDFFVDKYAVLFDRLIARDKGNTAQLQNNIKNDIIKAWTDK